jgi:hypothetical protein
MPAPIAAVVGELISRCPEVWLIGSQANPTGAPPNDWDIVVKGNRQLLDDFRSRPQVTDLDLLIVYDGDQFECPWLRPRDGAKKSGSLKDWKWTQVSEDEASYRATKARDGEDFSVEVSTKKAIRLRHV